MNQEFDYHNLIGRPSGPFVRFGAKFLPGVRTVQQQIVPYAEAWRAHNARMMAGDDPVWVVLGDSMAQGIGAKSHDQGWAGQLADILQQHGRKYRLINLSISGSRIEDVVERQIPALNALGVRPELITVLVGSNDLVRKKYRVRALSNFDALLEQLPPGSIVSNLLGAQGVPLAIDQRLRRAVQERNLVLADLHGSAPRTWRGLVAEDHFHPNEAGYRVIADAFAQAIIGTNAATES